MHKTQFAGLTELDPGDAITVDGGSFTQDNPSTTDGFLRIGAVTHRHDAHAALINPVAPPSASAATSGGQIPNDTTVYVAYTIEDQDGGETLRSTAAQTTTQATPNPPSTQLTAQFFSSAGTLPSGQYVYGITLNDTGGGESLIGPPVFVTRSPGYASGEILLTGLAAELGGIWTSWNLWRAQDGGDFQLMKTGGTTNSFADTGLVCVDSSRTPPEDMSGVAQTNELFVLLPTPSQEHAFSSAALINLYLSTDGTFANPCFYQSLPLASAGQSIAIPSLALSEGAPPSVSRALPGANQIDPDTSLLDWHWKRPVLTPAGLPVVGNASADVRLSVSPLALFAYSTVTNSWQVVAAASGVAPKLTFQDAFGASAAEPKFGVQGRGVTRVRVIDHAANASGTIVVHTSPWTASAGTASATVGDNPDGQTGGMVQQLGFAGSGVVGVQLIQSGGSATVVITAPTMAGPQGIQGPAGASGAVGATGASGAVGATGPPGSSANFFASAGNAQKQITTFLGFAASGGVQVELQDVGGGSAVVMISASGFAGPAGPAGSSGGGAGSIQVEDDARITIINPASDVRFAASGGVGLAVQNLGGGSARVLIGPPSGGVGGGGVIMTASGITTPSETTISASGSAGVRVTARDLGGGTGQFLIGLPQRVMDTFTTPALASGLSTTTVGASAGASASMGLPLGRLNMLLQVMSDQPMRLRLYTKQSKMLADALRVVGTDPSPNSGLLLELVNDPSNLVYDLDPMVIAAVTESSSQGQLGTGSTVWASVQNLGSSINPFKFYIVKYPLEP